MKTTKILLAASLIAALAFIAGWKFALARKTPAIPMPGQIAFLKTNPPASALPAARVANPTAGSGAAASTPDEAGMALADAIDTLTSPQSSFAQKLAVRDKLRKEGRLNDIMGALKQLASQNPNDATIATALGEAELGQARYLLDNGATPASTEVAVLALQADQSFNAALSADPTNWEAEFEKAAADVPLACRIEQRPGSDRPPVGPGDPTGGGDDPATGVCHDLCSPGAAVSGSRPV
jgi:hypothetical protein